MRRFRARRTGGADERPGPVVMRADASAPDGFSGAGGPGRFQAEGITALTRLAVWAAGRASATEVEVTVRPWTPANRHVAVRLAHLPGLLEHSVRIGADELRVTLRLRAPLDLGRILQAVLAAADPAVRGRPGPGEPEVVAGVPVDSGDVGLPGTVVLCRLADLTGEAVRAADVVVGADVVPAARRVEIAPLRLDPLVDPLVHRPVGRESGDGVVATLRVLDQTWEVRSGERVVRTGTGVDLTDLDVAALQPVARIAASGPLTAVQVRLLVQASAAGVVVSALPPASVHPVLAGAWAAPAPAGPDEVIAASIVARRAAHRFHGIDRALGVADPTLSVLLCSNRAEHLRECLHRLREVDLAGRQLLVGLHGIDADGATRAALADVGTADTALVPVPADVPFGAALAELTRRSDGAFLTKIDDDDRYGPDHFWDLLVARRYSGAAVVGKGAEHVYLADRDETVRRTGIRPERYGRTVAGGAMLIARGDLEQVGGWRPVPRSVDRALLDRVLRAGGGVYRTHGHGFVYVRGTHPHTWAVEADYFEQDVVERWPGVVVP